jgi:tRNA(Arg) A34 adenosine deaminase TadA
MNTASSPIAARRWSVISLLLATASFTTAATVSVAPLPDDPACTEQDRAFMKRANEMAAQTAARGNSSYGAVLVKDGAVLMEFGNDAKISGDVTHHAETGLISLASRKLGKDAVKGATLYTSTEPCIMCCGAIRAAGIKEFVYGTTAIQVTRLRGGKVPEHPLQCREVFARIGSEDVIIRGPLLEGDGLAVHAAASAVTTK